VRLARVYHSGYLRAQQTADMLARYLGIADRVEKRDGLAPNDAAAPIARWLLDPAVFDTQHGLALVGHLPFLELLAARLVAAREDARILVLEPATLVKLSPRPERDGYSIAWVLTPDLA
jgi:phosphohistidine phosphatase